MNMHVTMTATSSHNPRAEWIRGLTAFRIARDEHEQFEVSVWRPISDRLDRIAPHPGCSFEVEVRNGQIAQCTLFPAELYTLDDHPSATVRAKAAMLRDRWLEHLAARETLGYDTASTESERLCNLMCDREGELLVMPVLDREALLWKLERLFGPDVRKDNEFCGSWCPEWINAVMDDARRLMSDGAVTNILPALTRAA